MKKYIFEDVKLNRIAGIVFYCSRWYYKYLVMCKERGLSDDLSHEFYTIAIEIHRQGLSPDTDEREIFNTAHREIRAVLKRYIGLREKRRGNSKKWVTSNIISLEEYRRAHRIVEGS